MNRDMLKKKRKSEDAFEDYDYIYGIVTTGNINNFFSIDSIIPNSMLLSMSINSTNNHFIPLATDWYFILHSTDVIYSTSKTEYRISLTEESINPIDLRKSGKKILEIIVGLLNDRVSASKEPLTKKRRVYEKKIKKTIQ